MFANRTMRRARRAAREAKWDRIGTPAMIFRSAQ